MKIRFIHLTPVAALIALLPTSADAFMRYGGGGGVHYSGGGGMHYGGGGMHPIIGGHPMPQGYQMREQRFGPRLEERGRIGPPVVYGGGGRRYGGFGSRGYGGGGVVIERGGYGGQGYGFGGYAAGAYGFSRWHHHEGGVRETFVERRRPTIVSRDPNCCCDTGVSVVDPPVIEHGLTPQDEELLLSSYK